MRYIWKPVSSGLLKAWIGAGGGGFGELGLGCVLAEELDAWPGVEESASGLVLAGVRFDGEFFGAFQEAAGAADGVLVGVQDAQVVQAEPLAGPGLDRKSVV